MRKVILEMSGTSIESAWIVATLWDAGVHIMGSRTFNNMADSVTTSPKATVASGANVYEPNVSPQE